MAFSFRAWIGFRTFSYEELTICVRARIFNICFPFGAIMVYRHKPIAITTKHNHTTVTKPF